MEEPAISATCWVVTQKRSSGENKICRHRQTVLKVAFASREVVEKKWLISKGLQSAFLEALKEQTAGDPMRPEVRWTNLACWEIADALADAGYPVSRNIVRQLLKLNGYARRKAQKSLAMGCHADQDAQFKNIRLLKQEYQAMGYPVISMDTKKKERLGNFYRDGKVYTQEAIKTFDHDFTSASEGVVIPHGLYDVQRNEGYLFLGNSRDTSEFACDNLYRWWMQYGLHYYPQADSVLLLCDGGGSNNANHYLFKEDLQKLADRIGIEIRVAHYPPYTSKYNPIEHRLFPHVTRACQGVVFDSLETVKQLMAKTRTRTGLEVVVETVDKIYQTGRQYAQDFKQTMTIAFDSHLPKWNYTAAPSVAK